MKEKIIEYLLRLQEEKNIEILFASETGSRAWGFPSPDSDYDIRFIYKHPKDWYLSLEERKDTIEKMLENNDFDLSGWDLKKSLNLLRKSNPPLLERIQSPIVYLENKEFVSGINEIAKQNYSKIATMHHYLSMAKKMFYDFENEKEIKLKKLFYALRTSVACKWILEKDEIPPIVFSQMIENLDFKISIKQRIIELIALKFQKSEAYLHYEEKEINQFIRENIDTAERNFKSLPSSKGNIRLLNEFFIKTLQ